MLQRLLNLSLSAIGITNWFPETKSMRSLIDRCFSYKIEPSHKELASLLASIAAKEDKFPNRAAAATALEFLTAKLSDESINSEEINLRALNRLYEIIDTTPDNWEQLAHIIFSKRDPDRLIRDLSISGRSANRQAKEFSSRTGLSERTFWNRRKRVLIDNEAIL